MSEFDERPMDEIVRRLREERPQATDLELDRIKLTAMSRSTRAERTRRSARPRLAGLLIALGLLAGGTGALAASGGTPFNSSSKSKSASKVEYCESENGDEQGQNEQDRFKGLENDIRSLMNGIFGRVQIGQVSRHSTTQGDNSQGDDCDDQGENGQGGNEQGGNGDNKSQNESKVHNRNRGGG
ncbi:MAG: hypothetical protein C5B48_02140 [Candidatus Rokuibacteriota bacterium]|nr:MAG: hypothetical protein C5B48_02140 [Candidatus Rokubacteria bacterium]